MMEYLVFAGVLATIIATFIYIRLMFTGTVKPNRITWFMWAFAPFIATAAAASSGVGLAALPVFMAGFGPFLIFIASFIAKESYWRPSKFDYLCGAISALALVLWFLTDDPNVAIVFAMASDGLAAVPTLKKAWAHPKTESVWPYMVGVFNALTSFGAISLWSFPEYAFPSYLIAINIVLVLSVYHKRLAPWGDRQKQTQTGQVLAS